MGIQDIGGTQYKVILCTVGTGTKAKIIIKYRCTGAVVYGL